MKQVVFVGHFAQIARALEQASSSAGNQVQRQIINEIGSLIGNNAVASCVMAPKPAWPNGPLLIKTEYEENIVFFGYINLPLIKHLIFSAKLFYFVKKIRPEICLQYNSYFIENLTIIFLKSTGFSKLISIIIQDVYSFDENILFSRKRLRTCVERWSLVFARHFDSIVPIANEIMYDFCLPTEKCHIFQGGVTKYSLDLSQEPCKELEQYGVFAGALEPYNGVDLLVDKWIQEKTKYKLHIFGRGSLGDYVKQAANRCENILYHGFQPEDVILIWQKRAQWHFCLRYSKGLNQAYFFPSKFFNIVCAQGVPLVNNFHGLPDTLRKYVGILSDNLDNLNDNLEGYRCLGDSRIVGARREAILLNHSWQSCVRQIISQSNAKKQ